MTISIIFKDPISKEGHILRYWGLGHQYPWEIQLITCQLKLDDFASLQKNELTAEN